MVDILPTGFPLVASLDERYNSESPTTIIYGHRAGHGLFTGRDQEKVFGKYRDTMQGADFTVIIFLYRLNRMSAIHSENPYGKMADEAHQALVNAWEAIRPLGHIKPMLPIASGGAGPHTIVKIALLLNTLPSEYDDPFMINSGGGTHCHPIDTRAGGRGCWQAMETYLAVKHLDESERDAVILSKLNEYYEMRLGVMQWDPDAYKLWLKSLDENSMIVVEQSYVDKELPRAISLKAALEKPDEYENLKMHLEKFRPEFLASLQ